MGGGLRRAARRARPARRRRGVRPRGRLRHAAGMLSRSSRMGARVALERDAGLRARRLAAAAGARGAQRLRRSRPTMRGLVARPGGRIEWRALPSPPPPRPDAAVVHPVAVATCDLDRALALGTT